MNEVRVGLAGLGKRGLGWMQRHLKRLDGYRITAMCDPIAYLRDKALDALGEDVPVYPAYEELLADANVDAIALCVRSKHQGAMAAQALDAGKHVNSEVPAAHTIEDCWRIVLSAERSGLVYQLAEQRRYSGYVDAWRDLISDGKLGRVTYCESQYFHYLGHQLFFQDPGTGEYIDVRNLEQNPQVRPGWMNDMPSIHYLPHELSPMLKIIDDRVVEVTAMSTGSPSYSHPEIDEPDMQVALMKTEKDAILRMAASFTVMYAPKRGYHWQQVIGTRGSVEWNRDNRGRPLMWLAGSQMHDMAEVDWRYERTDAPAEASGSGHGDADYYPQVNFRDAVLHGSPLDIDVYQAMDTAAPAILAVESIAQGSKLLKVPDFRPNESRKSGQEPPGGIS